MADDNKSTLKINLHLYDTDLSVTIPREDEEYYRKAANHITNAMNAYASKFKGKWSDKHISYMAMVEFAYKLEKEIARKEPTQLYSVLDKLTSEIDALLEE